VSTFTVQKKKNRTDDWIRPVPDGSLNGQLLLSALVYETQKNKGTTLKLHGMKGSALEFRHMHNMLGDLTAGANL
jgi:hypothetical protein